MLGRILEDLDQISREDLVEINQRNVRLDTKLASTNNEEKRNKIFSKTSFSENENIKQILDSLQTYFEVISEIGRQELVESKKQDRELKGDEEKELRSALAAEDVLDMVASQLPDDGGQLERVFKKAEKLASLYTTYNQQIRLQYQCPDIGGRSTIEYALNSFVNAIKAKQENSYAPKPQIPLAQIQQVTEKLALNKTLREFDQDLQDYQDTQVEKICRELKDDSQFNKIMRETAERHLVQENKQYMFETGENQNVYKRFLPLNAEEKALNQGEKAAKIDEYIARNSKELKRDAVKEWVKLVDSSLESKDTPPEKKSIIFDAQVQVLNKESTLSIAVDKFRATQQIFSESLRNPSKTTEQKILAHPDALARRETTLKQNNDPWYSRAIKWVARKVLTAFSLGLITPGGKLGGSQGRKYLKSAKDKLGLFAASHANQGAHAVGPDQKENVQHQQQSAQQQQQQQQPTDPVQQGGNNSPRSRA